MSGEAADESVLRLRGVDLRYGRAAILSGVNLEVRSGEFWFLLGRNGVGKTTCLRAVLGLLRPHRGVIERHPVHADRKRVGFVPQRCEINRSLPTTVREFVGLGFVGSGVPRSERDERLGWALERAGLAGRASSNYWSLSGGQRQRALVARALVRRPRLMILDEPTEGMDVASEEEFLRTLDDLNREEGMTLLFVTHRLFLARRHATHVALFGNGEVRAGVAASQLVPSEVRRVFGVDVDLEPALGVVPV